MIETVNLYRDIQVQAATMLEQMRASSAVNAQVSDRARIAQAIYEGLQEVLTRVPFGDAMEYVEAFDLEPSPEKEIFVKAHVFPAGVLVRRPDAGIHRFLVAGRLVLHAELINTPFNIQYEHVKQQVAQRGLYDAPPAVAVDTSNRIIYAPSNKKVQVDAIVMPAMFTINSLPETIKLPQSYRPVLVQAALQFLRLLSTPGMMPPAAEAQTEEAEA